MLCLCYVNVDRKSEAVFHRAQSTELRHLLLFSLTLTYYKFEKLEQKYRSEPICRYVRRHVVFLLTRTKYDSAQRKYNV